MTHWAHLVGKADGWCFLPALNFVATACSADWIHWWLESGCSRDRDIGSVRPRDTQGESAMNSVIAHNPLSCALNYFVSNPWRGPVSFTFWSAVFWCQPRWDNFQGDQVFATDSVQPDAPVRWLLDNYVQTVNVSGWSLLKEAGQGTYWKKNAENIFWEVRCPASGLGFLVKMYFSGWIGTCVLHLELNSVQMVSQSQTWYCCC